MKWIGSKDNRFFVFPLVVLMLGVVPVASATKSYRRVVFPNGVQLRAEVAETSEAHTLGLMFREHLPEGEGMLFIFEKADRHIFWTKNCKFPLDILWLDQHGKIVHMVENVPPCAKDPCPTYGPEEPASYVLETRGGIAKKNQLQRGMTLRLS